MSSSIDLPLETLDKHEEDCIFPRFDANVAFELGCLIRKKAQSHEKAVAIHIARDNGQVFFHTLSKPGTSLDNQKWIDRKKNAVFRFYRSSFYMGCKLRKEGKTPASLAVSEEEFAFHGGGFPIRVKGIEGVVGVIIVSGLRQDEDHKIIVDSIEEYLKSQ